VGPTARSLWRRARSSIFLGVSAAQTPPMAGGYTNTIPIPVDDPQVKAIAGALFKPQGAGPFRRSSM
jgi:hypothetical protein